MKISFNEGKRIIKIIAPASKFDDLNDVLKRSAILFEKEGFHSSVSDGLFSQDSMEFYSNTLEYRFNDFRKALEDEEVKIIWCIRGGYGSSEVGNLLLDYELKSPKLLIGISDITSLHLLFNHKFSIASIHGEMLSGIMTENKLKNLESVFSILKGGNISYELKQLNSFLYDKIDQTSITGVNLTVICSNIGGILKREFFDDKILLLEDIGEKSYKIMRSLMQLFHGGFLYRLKAIIFGDFTSCGADTPKILQDFIDRYCSGIPVFQLNDVGHGEMNKPIILGAPAIISSDRLSIDNFLKDIIE